MRSYLLRRADATRRRSPAAGLPMQCKFLQIPGLSAALAAALISNQAHAQASQRLTASQRLIQNRSATTEFVSGWSVGGAWGSSSDDSNALRVSLSKPWRRRWFEGGTAYLTGYWDISLARFENDIPHVAEDDGTARLWNLAAAPVFRLQFNLGAGQNGQPWPVQPFMDLGVGISFMSDQNFRTGKARSRPLGSRFQFEDRGAVGMRGHRWELAYQRMHYSNLDLASANNGIDAHLLQLRWSW